jgi:hypothetical protein
MRYQCLAILALAIATPAWAQQTPSTNSAFAENAPDPARIAAAKPVIEKLWPLGTYRRMMDGSMSKIMDTMMESMMGMRASDIVGPIDKSGKATEAVDGSSMGEVAAKADPNFRERMKLTMDAMMSGMIPIMEKIEPQVVENLTKIYARRFSTTQLADMAAFFATPSGKAYAEQSMLVFMDPEMIQGMQAFVPELMKSMPDILKKAEEATKHLPPPPKPKDLK